MDINLKKIKIQVAICFLFIFAFCMARSVYADSNAWETSDFVTEGDVLYGFSKSGVEKLANNPNLVLPTEVNGNKITKVASFAFVYNKKTAIAEYTEREGEFGEISDKDVDGNKIKPLGEEFNQAIIKSVTIPEGYTYVGQDAFSFNKNLAKIELGNTIKRISEYAFAHLALTDIKLPTNLKTLGDQAFFDNKIGGTLELPANLEKLGERSFKSNRITDIKFDGNKLTTIPEECFQDNKLSKLTIPLSIVSIEEGAFSGNDGDPEYGNFVVLLTENGQNPNNLQDNGYYVNPSEDKKNSVLDIDYSTWSEDDFKVDGDTILGFSQIGELKVKRNKNLVIPDTIKGVEIKNIANDAFRNVDFGGGTLKKYDIETVQLPNTLENIGDFAFQSNNISELETPETLKYIGKGAFMNNRIETLVLNDELEVIDDAAFHINNVNAIIVPSGVKKIGISAFRQNGAQFVMIMSPTLEEIGEMAFTSNAIESLDLSANAGLKRIGVQAFRSNLISELVLPESLESIDEEAFKENKLTSVNIPDSVKKVAFNAFDYNTGDPSYDNKVVLNVSDDNDIPDGDGYIAGPNKLAKNVDDLKAIVDELKSTNLDGLRDETKAHFKSMINDGDNLLKKNGIRQGEKLKFINEARFFLDRNELDKMMRLANEALNSPKVEKNVPLLKSKLEYANTAYNNAAVTSEGVKRLVQELKFLTDLVKGTGEISKATMVQGHHELNSPLPIPSYHIGVNVYFDENGKILYVLDMSYTIGAGTLDEYGNEILNVDEDNEGYHMLALPTLADYEGISYSDILANDVDSINKIRKIDDRAKYHREGFYKAVKDAANDYKALIENNKTNDNKEKLDIRKPKYSLTTDSMIRNDNSNIIATRTTDTNKTLPKTGIEFNILCLIAFILISGVLIREITHKNNK